MEAILKEAHRWMNDYMKSFYCEDQDIMFGIQMKEKHTGYVTAHAKALAAHLQLPQHDVLLAELMGLMHDVGRFRQWQLYKTFVDAKSEDHADLGVKVIRELGFFQKLEEDDQELLLFAIKNHNKKEIAPAPSKLHLLFAKLLRDADKLDIFRVLAPYLQVNPDVANQSETLQKFMKGPNGDATGEVGSFAPGFLDSFVEGRQVDYTMIQTNEDRKLVRLMWVYDVNFAWTLTRIQQKGYIDAIIANMPTGEKMSLGIKRLKDHVARKCATPDVPIVL